MDSEPRQRASRADRARPDGSAPRWVELVSVEDAGDAREILIGLNVRSINARAATEPGPGLLKRPRHRVYVDPSRLEQARAALPHIWSAILGDRAVDPAGRCGFCGYDTTPVPNASVCPECGTDLLSVEARLRARRGFGRAGGGGTSHPGP